MSSAEAKLIELNDADLVEVEAAIERWQHFPASAISHHGRQCCRLAREWIFSTDYSQLNGENLLSGPRWLRQKFTWGPSPWPITWCEVVERKTLDCGALASLAHEVFTARGVQSFPAQLIQRFSERATRQWSCKWAADDASLHWIKESLIYHEGCAVLVSENKIRIWDPSAGWWINPKQFGGYGGLLAARIFANTLPEETDHFVWAGHRITPNQWQKIETTRADAALPAASATREALPV